MRHGHEQLGGSRREALLDESADGRQVGCRTGQQWPLVLASAKLAVWFQ